MEKLYSYILLGERLEQPLNPKNDIFKWNNIKESFIFFKLRIQYNPLGMIC